ncbi:MAG: CrcB family protein [Candidatus Nanopelagicales bacterium]|nr:CrcB family protein [Candidatus Nanopelagicales bacterium]
METDVGVPPRGGEDAQPRLVTVVGLVAAGGALGATVRYSVETLMPHAPMSFPVATFLVNSVGCLLMGLFLGRLSVLGNVPPHLTPAITTGFLGGLTTFSAFASEIVLMSHGDVVSQGDLPETAVIYAVATLTVGLLLVKGGWMFARLSPKAGG